MIAPSSEYTYFCFPETQVVRKFLHIPVSEIGDAGDVVLSRKADLYAEGCRRFLTDLGHWLDEQCGIWRYVFFMQYPGLRCVRQVRIAEGLVAVGEITEI